METRKVLLGLTLVIVLLLFAVVWFYPPTGDFKVENPFWNGLSSLSSQGKIVILDSLANLPSVGKGSAFLVVPYVQFRDAELEQIKSYVSTGGTLVLLDDYGFGNQVLASLGLNMKFTGQSLLDPVFDYNSKWLPKITDFTTTPLSTNISSIVFNHATALNTTSAISVVAYSSSFSFLDLNSNGNWDSDEPNGPFPVAAYTKMDQGAVVAVADSSLIINSMLNVDDNLHFIKNAASAQDNNPQVFVDQTHLPKTPLDEAKDDLGVVYDTVSSPLITIGVISVALALSLKLFFKRAEKYDTKC
jgi:hypothetical protein